MKKVIKLKDYNTSENREKLVKYFKQEMHIMDAIKRVDIFFKKPSEFPKKEFVILLSMLKPKGQ